MTRYAALLVLSTRAFAQTDWPSFGNDPGAMRYSALQQIKNSLGLKSGKNALVTSVGCSSKKHKIGVKITYVPNPTPPATTTASDSSNAKCSK